MKRKLLSILLALTMVTSLFSGMTITAGAEGAEEPAVAKWVTVAAGAEEPTEGWSAPVTLTAAFAEANAADSDKVTYVKLTGSASISKAGYEPVGLQLDADKTMVLDLSEAVEDDETVELVISADHMAVGRGIRVNGDLTLRNGDITITNPNASSVSSIYGIVVGASGKLTVNNCDIAVKTTAGTAQGIVNDVENGAPIITVSDSTIDVDGVKSAYGINLTATKNAVLKLSDTSLTVNDGCTYDTYGIDCSTRDSNDKIYLSGDTTISGGDAGIYVGSAFDKVMIYAHDGNGNALNAASEGEYIVIDGYHINGSFDNDGFGNTVVYGVTEANAGNFKPTENGAQFCRFAIKGSNLATAKHVDPYEVKTVTITVDKSKLKKDVIINTSGAASFAPAGYFKNAKATWAIYLDGRWKDFPDDYYWTAPTISDNAIVGLYLVGELMGDYHFPDSPSTSSVSVTVEGYQVESVGFISTYKVYGYIPLGTRAQVLAELESSSTVPVTSVTLNKSNTELTVGETETLTATVLPENATNKAVTWSSNNSAVATVADGVVTALAPGEATITVATTEGNFTDTCLVTVTAAQSGGQQPGGSTVISTIDVDFNWTGVNPTNPTNAVTLSPAHFTTQEVYWFYRGSEGPSQLEYAEISGLPSDTIIFAMVAGQLEDGYTFAAAENMVITCDDYVFADGQFENSTTILMLFRIGTASDVLALFPDQPSGDDTHSHCVCGATSCNSHGGVKTWTGVASLDEITSAGNYYLTADVNIDSAWEPVDGTVLCLNGHVVNANMQTQNVIVINSGNSFTLTDCDNTTTHKFSVSEETVGLWELAENGEEIVIGGVITGAFRAGVKIDSGIFNMYGGNIVGNNGRTGGGIFGQGSNATANIYGGTICGNVARDNGAGIGVILGTINLYGGVIENNTTQSIGGIGGVYFDSSFNVQGAPVIKGNKANGVENNVKINAGAGSSEGEGSNLPVITITGPLHRDAEIGVTVGNDSFFTNGWSAHMVNRDPGEYFFADEANGVEGLIAFERSTNPDNLFAPVELRFIKLNDNDIINVEAPDYGGDVNHVSISLDKTKTFGKLKNGESLPALEGTPVPEDPEVEIPDGFKMGLVSGSAQTSGVNALDSEKASIVSEWVYAETDDFVGIVNGQDLFQTMEDDHVVDKTNNVYFIKMTIIAPVTFTANTIAGQNGQFPVGIADTDPDTVDSMAFIPVRFEAKDNRITVFFMDATTIPGGDDTPDTPDTPVVPEYPYIPPVIPVTPPTVDVPVSNDENKVDVKAEVSGNDATIKPLDEEQIEQLVGDTAAAGDVVIDLTEMGKEINTAGIPKETLEAIVNAAENAENNTEHLVIKLSTAQLTLDDTAMRAIVDQADGDIIKFNFDDVGLGRLNKEQKEAVKDMDVRKGYEAYITVNGERVSDFNGGNVEIIVPYAVPADENIAGFSVWYIDEDGKPEKQKSTYDGKNKCFVVTHFSDYVIVYDEEDALEGNYRVCLKDETCPIHGYTDAVSTEWYHDGVHYCIENGLMTGLPGNLFDPNGATTRAQLVNILWRLEGKPVVNYAMSYTDVVADKWYTEAVRWATAEGIVLGHSDTVFAPNDAITREQMAAILWRYCKYKGIDVSVGENTNILSYNDAFDISGWAIPAMQWACGADVINGITDGDSMKLDPAGNATRAQVATMLRIFCVEIIGH